MMFEKGIILYAGWESQDGIEQARDYIRKYGFTYDDVRISRKFYEEFNDCGIQVVAKRKIPWA